MTVVLLDESFLTILTFVLSDVLVAVQMYKDCGPLDESLPADLAVVALSDAAGDRVSLALDFGIPFDQVGIVDIGLELFASVLT